MNDEIHKVPLVQKQIEEFGKKFASKFNIAYVRHKGFAFLGREILNFTAEYFLEQLTLAEKRGEEKARKEAEREIRSKLMDCATKEIANLGEDPNISTLAGIGLMLGHIDEVLKQTT